MQETSVARAGAQPYLGPRTWSGNMMIDGVPDVRVTEGVRPLNLSGKSTQQRGGDRRPAGANRGHQLKYGRHGCNASLRGHLLRSGVGQREGGIAQVTQAVIAAAQNFALHRQGRVLAVVALVLGRLPVVVGVIGRTAPGRTFGRLKCRPPQLG